MSPLQRRLRSAWRERACCAGEQPRGWAGSPPGLSFPSSEIVTDCSLQGRGDDTEPTQHIRPPTLVLPALRWLPGAALPACPSRPAALFTRHGAGPGRTRPVRGAGGALLDHVPSLWRSLKSSLAAAWSPLLMDPQRRLPQPGRPHAGPSPASAARGATFTAPGPVLQTGSTQSPS